MVGVNLGEIKIFALYCCSFILTTHMSSFFLLYLIHKCFKSSKWLTYWSIRHWEMTPKWSIFTKGLLSVTCAEPYRHNTKSSNEINYHPTERRVWAKFSVNKAQRVKKSEAEYKNSLCDCTTTRLQSVRWLAKMQTRAFTSLFLPVFLCQINTLCCLTRAIHDHGKATCFTPKLFNFWKSFWTGKQRYWRFQQ